MNILIRAVDSSTLGKIKPEMLPVIVQQLVTQKAEPIAMNRIRYSLIQLSQQYMVQPVIVVRLVIRQLEHLVTPQIQNFLQL